MIRPLRPTRPGAAREAAEKLSRAKPVRVVLEVPPGARHALKTRALSQGLTLRDYLLSLARSDGVTW